MPIYNYICKCGKDFEKFFPTMSKAKPYIEKYKCECGKTAERIITKAPKAFFKGSSKPLYSSPYNPNKE